jgi:hypothetical protein
MDEDTKTAIFILLGFLVIVVVIFGAVIATNEANFSQAERERTFLMECAKTNALDNCLRMLNYRKQQY